MKLLILPLSLLISLSTSKKFEKSEGIFVLTNKNYDAAVKEFDYLLVYFYAPWCGHCKRLKPEFEKCATDLMRNDPPVHLVKVRLMKIKTIKTILILFVLRLIVQRQEKTHVGGSR